MALANSETGQPDQGDVPNSLKYATGSGKPPWEETKEFWLKFCPELSIGTATRPADPHAPPKISESSVSEYRHRLRNDGFVPVDHPFPKDLVNKLKRAVHQLHEASLPPTAVLLFDETWELAVRARSLLEQITGLQHFQPDILAWFIDKAGFSPHRDRQPEDVESSFRGDDAKLVTLWVALSDANPSSSCLYMIPAGIDPGYRGKGDCADDPMRAALPDKRAFQHIRAVPRNAGESVMFTHRVIHWGSTASTAPDARVSISFVQTDPSFESPYLVKAIDGSPNFETRLLIVCAQLLVYHQRFELGRKQLQRCYTFCKAHQEELAVDYRQKVFYEYAQAMKEVQTQLRDDNDLFDEEEEALMAEILDAEEAGVGKFRDDFEDDESIVDEPESPRQESECSDSVKRPRLGE